MASLCPAARRNQPSRFSPKQRAGPMRIPYFFRRWAGGTLCAATGPVQEKNSGKGHNVCEKRAAAPACARRCITLVVCSPAGGCRATLRATRKRDPAPSRKLTRCPTAKLAEQLRNYDPPERGQRGNRRTRSPTANGTDRQALHCATPAGSRHRSSCSRPSRLTHKRADAALRPSGGAAGADLARPAPTPAEPIAWEQGERIRPTPRKYAWASRVRARAPAWSAQGLPAMYYGGSSEHVKPPVPDPGTAIPGEILRRSIARATPDAVLEHSRHLRGRRRPSRLRTIGKRPRAGRRRRRPFYLLRPRHEFPTTTIASSSLLRRRLALNFDPERSASSGRTAKTRQRPLGSPDVRAPVRTEPED